MFSLDQLRGFVSVAEEQHFGRAAVRLNMTQPPLSRQIQKLERAVGVQLLVRDNRSVELTSAGAAFLVEARRLLALAGSAPDLARRIAAGSCGTVRLGFTAASTLDMLPALLNRVGWEVPDIGVELREMITREQTEALLGAEIDLGLGRPRFDPALIDSRVVLREPLRVVVPTGHRLASLERAIGHDDLVGEPLIMHSAEEAQYLHELVLAAVPIAGRRVVHTVSQLLTMVSLVAAGRGVAFLPDSAIRLGIGGVEFLPLAVHPEPHVELHLMWLKQSKNPALWRVLDVLGETLAG